jgi:DMSO/TMAO reductase YedYZ molybdopterin-dependent catalytic subunit
MVFLADEKNGAPLEADYAPLRISGDVPKGSFRVSQLKSITLDFTEIPEWAITLEGTEKNVTMSIAELEAYFRTYTASAGFKKVTGTIVGPDEYTGVMVEDLLDEVGIEGDYSLLVVPTDYFNTTFTKSQVEGNVTVYDLEGNDLGTGGVDMLLTFKKNNVYSFDGELPRIIYINDSTAITDGHFWVKEAMHLIVETESIAEWSLNISGLTDYEMSRDTYEAIANCDWHRTTWIDIDDSVWEGVPLWVMVSTVDGNDTQTGHAEGTFGFNDTLAEAGYNVTVRAGDDYNTTFSSNIVARNNSIILAYMMNGERLEGGQWPLRLVGEGLSGSQKVRNVVSIELGNLP